MKKTKQPKEKRRRLKMGRIKCALHKINSPRAKCQCISAYLIIRRGKVRTTSSKLRPIYIFIIYDIGHRPSTNITLACFYHAMDSIAMHTDFSAEKCVFLFFFFVPFSSHFSLLPYRTHFFFGLFFFYLNSIYPRSYSIFFPRYYCCCTHPKGLPFHF